MESNGSKTIALFNKVKPDICLLGVMLPGKDGFTLAGEIRKIDQQIPIIFFTAKTQTEDLVKGFSLGGNDYIRKPFSLEELIVRMQYLLSAKNDTIKNTQHACINFGTYTFQVNRQLLSNGEGKRELSFRESELLKLLYHRRERIIERKEILDLLWGNGSFFNSRNLDVYITRLRSYLKHDPALEILTIKGVGYRFVVV